MQRNQKNLLTLLVLKNKSGTINFNLENKFDIMNDNSLNYEYLIRRAYQCGRSGRKGADADIFRRLKFNALMYYNAEQEFIKTGTRSNSNKNIKKLLDKYIKDINEVSSHIRKAIDHVKKKYVTKLTDEQYNELEKIAVLLIEPDIKKIDEAIERAEKVMLEIKLYPQ